MNLQRKKNINEIQEILASLETRGRENVGVLIKDNWLQHKMGTFKNCSEKKAHGLGSPEAVSFGGGFVHCVGGLERGSPLPCLPCPLHPIRSKSERAAALNKKRYLKPPCD